MKHLRLTILLVILAVTIIFLLLICDYLLGKLDSSLLGAIRLFFLIFLAPIIILIPIALMSDFYEDKISKNRYFKTIKEAFRKILRLKDL